MPPGKWKMSDAKFNAGVQQRHFLWHLWHLNRRQQKVAHPPWRHRSWAFSGDGWNLTGAAADVRLTVPAMLE